jgi:predicted phosphodiesterase
MILLSSDWHLDDNPNNEYRWIAIEQILHAVIQYKVGTVFILGDLVDRKDRHSGAFVNRLITELRKIAARTCLVILRGNHDTPMRGPAFWEFTSNIDHIHYVSRPESFHLFNNDQPDLLLLPFTAQPKQDWADIRLSTYQALFMHATVTGAVVENGQVMENSRFPILPRRIKIYSGDVHVPQSIRNITYCGAPFPIKFGDTYPCRMLLLNEEFEIALELPVHSPRKLMIDITNARQLADLKIARGDQVKLRFNCSAAQVGDWGAIERTINEWATNQGIIIAGTEVMVDNPHPLHRGDSEQTPEQILRQFAVHERISEELLEVGLKLLEATQ